MATRTYSESKNSKWKATRSHALCDDCGKEDEKSYLGRVTAPLPNGWAMSMVESKSGGSTKIHYNCGCKA